MSPEEMITKIEELEAYIRLMELNEDWQVEDKLDAAVQEVLTAEKEKSYDKGYNAGLSFTLNKQELDNLTKELTHHIDTYIQTEVIQKINALPIKPRLLYDVDFSITKQVATNEMTVMGVVDFRPQRIQYNMVKTTI